MVNSPDEEIAQIGNVDLSRTAVIDQTKFQIGEFHADSLAKINLISYEPNNLVYEASTRSNTLAVFSEIFYPRGWKAFVDGSEAKILRVNYVLRALEVPAGEHKIEFRFEPDSYYIGNKIMMISSLILILAIGYGLFKLWKASEMNHLQEV
jgi:hypothetical protein